ncbi:MAG: phage holin family protein [Vicinamibacterales bacterium]
MKAGLQTHAEPSWASLLTGIADEAKELLLQEVALTKLEIRYELIKARSAAISLGIAIGTIAIGSMLLALMLVHGLAAQSAVPLWGCYGIVGGVIAAIGAGALVFAKSKAVKLDVTPRRSLAPGGLAQSRKMENVA